MEAQCEADTKKPEKVISMFTDRDAGASVPDLSRRCGIQGASLATVAKKKSRIPVR
jgi:hypothetical protein